MNRSPVTLALTSAWKGKSPGAGELAALLNLFSEASLILEAPVGTIHLVNGAFLKITSFTQPELAGIPLADVIPDLSLVYETNEAQTGYLHRKSRSPLQVMVQIYPLDQSGRWLLLSVLPQLEKPDDIQPKTEEFFSAMGEVSTSFDQPDLDSALLHSLKTFTGLIGGSIAVIYENDGSFPRLVKKSFIEPTPVLPDALPSSDLVRLSNPQLWLPGKRMVTDLHRNARLTDVSFLASIPFGTEGAFLGLLVIGDNFRPPRQNILELMKLISSHLNSLYHHFILINNLRQSSSRLESQITIRNAQVENAQEAILVLKPDLRVAEVNPAVEWLLGYANQEVRNQPIENILIGTDRLMPALESTIEGRTIQNLGVVSLHRRNGESFPALIEIIPLRDEDILRAILIFVTNVSESEDFHKRTRQLEYKATLGDFIVMFSHEVRNPLSNVMLGLQSLSESAQPDDPLKKPLNMMLQDCQRISQLMEDVLAWNKQAEPRFEKMDLVRFVRNIIDRWRPRFFKANVTPLFQAVDKLPQIMADPRQLDQVFVNLISNATEAMSQNGGILTIRIATSDEIPNRPQLVVVISDNGPGIPDGVRDHIFDPFYTTKTRGTGLGLSITKRIVDAHHGNISVISLPGGTAFHIHLPIAPMEV